MLFNSFEFLLLFLPIVLGVAYFLKGQSLLRWVALTSVVFYSFAGHVWFIVPMLITTCLDFWVAPRIEAANSQRAKRTWLWLSLVGNLGLLFYFKYSNLIVTSAAQTYALFTGHPPENASGFLSLFQVVLPAGISFYTFQTLSYIIDVYRGKAHAETNFWKFVGFVSFFPHLVAGPLTRHDQLIPQLDAIAKTGVRSQWRDGVFLFAVGLAKKTIIADQIAGYVHPLIGDSQNMTMATAWLATLGFTMQIYFDFSGYSDMAIGLGRLFGIELPQNFNSPYKAKDPSDFWRRWHISLSQWLRDYLYISLGGNRCSPLRRNFNLIATMVLGGLWHGANWTFAIWGFYHGMLLTVFHFTEPAWKRLPERVQQLGMLFLVMIGWVFFRARDIGEAGTWLARMFDFGNVGLSALTRGNLLLALYVCVGGVLVLGFPNAAPPARLTSLQGRTRFALGVVTLVAVLRLNYTSAFLYFQF